RAMFDLNADWLAIVPVLRADSMLAQRIDAAPGMRVPGCWDGFELAARAILGRNMTAQLVRQFGKPFPSAPGLTHIFPTAASLAEAPVPKFGSLPRAVHDRRIPFDGDPEECIARLREISGISAVTAKYVAMRALGEPDVFPCRDAALERRAEAWRPWRSY